MKSFARLTCHLLLLVVDQRYHSVLQLLGEQPLNRFATASASQVLPVA